MTLKNRARLARWVVRYWPFLHANVYWSGGPGTKKTIHKEKIMHILKDEFTTYRRRIFVKTEVKEALRSMYYALANFKSVVGDYQTDVDSLRRADTKYDDLYTRLDEVYDAIDEAECEINNLVEYGE